MLDQMVTTGAIIFNLIRLQRFGKQYYKIFRYAS